MAAIAIRLPFRASYLVNDVTAHTQLSGWGGWPRSGATLVRPTTPAELVNRGISPRGMIARGLGRSYGDAAQLAGGTVFDMTSLGGEAELDPDSGRI